MTAKSVTPKPKPIRRPADGYVDLDDLIYGRPERPGVRRNPISGRRVG